MTVSIWWLPVAFAFGGLIGVVTLALCAAASRGDEVLP